METIATELVDTGEKRDSRGRRLAVVQHRAAIIAAYERSGLTQRAFAEREGIKFFTFTAWLKRHRQGRTKARFVKVRIAARSPNSSTVEVGLPNGVVIRGGDVEQLVALVERLRRC